MAAKSWMEECLQIAREVFGPHAPDDKLGYIIWNHTGFPCFFDGDARKQVRAQLEEYKRRNLDVGPMKVAEPA